MQRLKDFLGELFRGSAASDDVREVDCARLNQDIVADTPLRFASLSYVGAGLKQGADGSVEVSGQKLKGAVSVRGTQADVESWKLHAPLDKRLLDEVFEAMDTCGEGRLSRAAIARACRDRDVQDLLRRAGFASENIALFADHSEDTGETVDREIFAAELRRCRPPCPSVAFMRNQVSEESKDVDLVELAEVKSVNGRKLLSWVGMDQERAVAVAMELAAHMRADPSRMGAASAFLRPADILAIGNALRDQFLDGVPGPAWRAVAKRLLGGAKAESGLAFSFEAAELDVLAPQHACTTPEHQVPPVLRLCAKGLRISLTGDSYSLAADSVDIYPGTAAAEKLATFGGLHTELRLDYGGAPPPAGPRRPSGGEHEPHAALTAAIDDAHFAVSEQTTGNLQLLVALVPHVALRRLEMKRVTVTPVGLDPLQLTSLTLANGVFLLQSALWDGVFKVDGTGKSPAVRGKYSDGKLDLTCEVPELGLDFSGGGVGARVAEALSALVALPPLRLGALRPLACEVRLSVPNGVGVRFPGERVWNLGAATVIFKQQVPLGGRAAGEPAVCRAVFEVSAAGLQAGAYSGDIAIKCPGQCVLTVRHSLATSRGHRAVEQAGSSLCASTGDLMLADPVTRRLVQQGAILRRDKHAELVVEGTVGAHDSGPSELRLELAADHSADAVGALREAFAAAVGPLGAVLGSRALGRARFTAEFAGAVRVLMPPQQPWNGAALCFDGLHLNPTATVPVPGRGFDSRHRAAVRLHPAERLQGRLSWSAARVESAGGRPLVIIEQGDAGVANWVSFDQLDGGLGALSLRCQFHQVKAAVTPGDTALALPAIALAAFTALRPPRGCALQVSADVGRLTCGSDCARHDWLAERLYLGEGSITAFIEESDPGAAPLCEVECRLPDLSAETLVHVPSGARLEVVRGQVCSTAGLLRAELTNCRHLILEGDPEHLPEVLSAFASPLLRLCHRIPGALATQRRHELARRERDAARSAVPPPAGYLAAGVSAVKSLGSWFSSAPAPAPATAPTPPSTHLGIDESSGSPSSCPGEPGAGRAARCPESQRRRGRVTDTSLLADWYRAPPSRLADDSGEGAPLLRASAKFSEISVRPTDGVVLRLREVATEVAAGEVGLTRAAASAASAELAARRTAVAPPPPDGEPPGETWTVLSAAAAAGAEPPYAVRVQYEQGCVLLTLPEPCHLDFRDDPASAAAIEAFLPLLERSQSLGCEVHTAGPSRWEAQWNGKRIRKMTGSLARVVKAPGQGLARSAYARYNEDWTRGSITVHMPQVPRKKPGEITDWVAQTFHRLYIACWSWQRLKQHLWRVVINADDLELLQDKESVQEIQKMMKEAADGGQGASPEVRRHGMVVRKEQGRIVIEGTDDQHPIARMFQQMQQDEFPGLNPDLLMQTFVGAPRGGVLVDEQKRAAEEEQRLKLESELDGLRKKNQELEEAEKRRAEAAPPPPTGPPPMISTGRVPPAPPVRHGGAPPPPPPPGPPGGGGRPPPPPPPPPPPGGGPPPPPGGGPPPPPGAPPPPPGGRGAAKAPVKPPPMKIPDREQPKAHETVGPKVRPTDQAAGSLWQGEFSGHLDVTAFEKEFEPGDEPQRAAKGLKMHAAAEPCSDLLSADRRRNLGIQIKHLPGTTEDHLEFLRTFEADSCMSDSDDGGGEESAEVEKINRYLALFPKPEDPEGARFAKLTQEEVDALKDGSERLMALLHRFPHCRARLCAARDSRDIEKRLADVEKSIEDYRTAQKAIVGSKELRRALKHIAGNVHSLSMKKGQTSADGASGIRLHALLTVCEYKAPRSKKPLIRVFMEHVAEQKGLLHFAGELRKHAQVLATGPPGTVRKKLDAIRNTVSCIKRAVINSKKVMPDDPFAARLEPCVEQWDTRVQELGCAMGRMDSARVEAIGHFESPQKQGGKQEEDGDSQFQHLANFLERYDQEAHAHIERQRKKQQQGPAGGGGDEDDAPAAAPGPAMEITDDMFEQGTRPVDLAQSMALF